MEDTERRDGSQLEVTKSEGVGYWLVGLAAGSEGLESAPERSTGGKTKEEVVEDVTRVEEGIVDRFEAKRMEGLIPVARFSPYAVADGNISRLRSLAGQWTMVRWQMLWGKNKKHGLRTHRGVHLEVDCSSVRRQRSVVISIQSNDMGR